jgi:hypothetical protein
VDSVSDILDFVAQKGDCVMTDIEAQRSRSYVPVGSGERRMYVEVLALGEEEEIGARDVDLDGLTRSLRAVAETVTDSLVAGLGKVKPEKVTVEFGCEVGVETGGLVAVLAKGTATANLKVTLEWTPK